MAEQERHILFKVKPALAGDQVADAVDIETDDTQKTGVLVNSPNVQNALSRLDNTGIGAAPRTFTGSFFCGSGNQDTWYGGRQNVNLVGERGQSNGNYIFELPDPTELNAIFDDMVTRGLGEIYTVTIDYLGGTTSSVIQNSMTIQPPSTSAAFNRGELPVTIGLGASVTFRIGRIGAALGTWERLGVTQAADPVATVGEVVIRPTSWNNRDGSTLPGTGQVLQGYAFSVVNSDPNDGTLRQGLIDSGVSDRIIFDGDFVVWTATSFTAWTDGGNWFVLSRDSLQRMSREQSNFLAQTGEIDNRIDLALAQSQTTDALVWVSQNPLAAAPFLEPSADTNNPRSGDDYRYIGGRENRNGQQVFQFSQNRFNSFMTLGITPEFITGHPESTIDIILRDTDGTILERWNLATDFVFRTDGDFTNGTVRHYTRSASVNYGFLQTIEIWLTQVQRHFVINPMTVNLTTNIQNLEESQLSPEVIEKLNRAIPDQGVQYSDIEPRLMRYITVSRNNPAGDALFLSDDGAGAYPSDLTGFSAVSESNPRFQASDIVLFVAVRVPGSFALRNTTADTVVALDQNEPTVDIVESLTVSDVTYFVYRVTSIISGNRYEVERITNEQVIEERNDISNLQDDVGRIDAELSHAALNLPAALVDVLDNEVSVTEETAPTVSPTPYNNSLGDTGTQTVFYETNPNSPGGGTLASKPISDTAGDRARRKLIYFPAGITYTGQAYLTAFDGTTGRDLIRHDGNGVFNARVRIPAIPASTVTNTVYPAPSNRVSGQGIWHNIPALTFVNGIPVPEADELFFTRNIPSSSVTLNIQYRGHANGNIFGASSTTLAGVGGGSNASVSFVLNDGSETATVEVLWRASSRDIRVSVTERVNAGLPTINDVEVILSYDETRTVPATNASTRDVPIENVHAGAQVFAIRPSATGTVIIVGDITEIDTGWDYTTVFGASENGHLIVPVETATYLDYEDFDPIATTITDLENHATLPQFGLFTTQYTHDTIVRFDTQLQAHNSQGDLVNLAEEVILVAPDNTRWRLTVDNSGNLSTSQVT